MDSRTVERVEGWDSRPYAGGFDELRGLADAEFSGAVTAGTTWLFMLNGRVVGVFDGTIDDYDDASGTAYEAPHPSLPLLFAMREHGGEERANYYTNDTPISEADSTLTSGKFTGYIELSENVLSGDYYVVYYGGRSMSCAFIGNQERLVTGDDAFDRADDEVGIYTVWDVDIDVVDIPGGTEPEPEPEPEPADDPATGTAPNGGTTTADSAATADPASGRREPVEDAEPMPSAGATEEAEPVAEAEPTHQEPEPEPATSAEPVAEAEPDPEPDEAVTDRTRGTGSAVDTTTGGDAAQADSAATPEPTPDQRTEDDERWEEVSDEVDADPVELPDEVLEAVEAESEEDTDPVFQEEAQWRETRSIPSINPEKSTESEAKTGTAGSPQPESRQSRTQRRNTSKTQPPREMGGSDTKRTGSTGTTSEANDRSSAPASDRAATGSASPSPSRSGTDEPLEREMLEREDKIDRLQQRLSNAEEAHAALQSERDELAAENDELQQTVDRLENEVADLEAEIADLESELANTRGAAATASVQLTPREALEGTNLFVRYNSKGDATLETAHGGSASPEEVHGNLRLEHHTQFEAGDAAVDGQAYEDFLVDSIEYQFVEWFVFDLLYEIRDTGNASAMSDLYDAIPEADRAELNGSVSLRYEENGEEHREQTTFDVVVRDRMGNPLVVANLNDSRDPATEDMMVDLEQRASRVKQTSEQLSGAFLVTASFFDPGALETAAEATSGSFLSRDSKKSFVKLSRKSGYHLCLVETRGGEFHINVPEL
ncbi:hypothetical protein [Haloarchaeobius sp. HME9146]|uniref:DUF7527 domain-containing protein n=1 Tax=Haloarchaeobius sp. HME9146 TaxID=2978732 RepID=UPI0021BF94B2|nr:hypothetical protein [Haloarchaeobius sp. HME9146]MCT9096581.1 hypothetical protein [Haloarchaeobius sp. HME9146]